MIKYSPSNSKTVRLRDHTNTGEPGVCRFIRTGTPYITRQYFSASWSDSYLYGGWMVFISDKTPEEIESMVSAGDYSFETVKSHGNEFAYFARGASSITDKIQYNQEGSPTFNFGKMLGFDADIAFSANGNGGIFTTSTGFTCKTVGIKFIGHVHNSSIHKSKQSESFFLFTVGDKDSDAEVKIHNPVLQAGDTMDLSDLTLTIQVPLEVE